MVHKRSPLRLKEKNGSRVLRQPYRVMKLESEPIVVEKVGLRSEMQGSEIPVMQSDRLEEGKFGGTGVGDRDSVDFSSEEGGATTVGLKTKVASTLELVGANQVWGELGGVGFGARAVGGTGLDVLKSGWLQVRLMGIV
ncbi:uncharacterized protein LOC120088694 [Benincasa hispida]|uniref:uncharacterized protein LOC120088694 n=1 Tax=Benincasa hispida TaxID=102211 RepID=UPI0019006974|nr:uncharacterized protein LOC120088694 [Benincasa hispida]XP_038902045.1 uncharacterized protein LOC120088694 [Benincasa hispida]